MKNIVKEIFGFIEIILILVIVIVGICFFVNYYVLPIQDETNKKEIIKCNEWNYHLRPQFVGTNEEGQVIKYYEMHIPRGNGFEIEKITITSTKE